MPSHLPHLTESSHNSGKLWQNCEEKKKGVSKLHGSLLVGAVVPWETYNLSELVDVGFEFGFRLKSPWPRQLSNIILQLCKLHMRPKPRFC
jgi:hypothetical protein